MSRDRHPLPLLLAPVRDDADAGVVAPWRCGSWPEFPVNEGALCRKGWSAAGLRGSRERLTSPLVRDRSSGELRPASWDEALDLVAARLATLRESDGPDSVAVFGGGGLTNEKAYQLGKFARVALGTSQIDYNGRWCMSSAASAGEPGVRRRPRAAVPARRRRADRRAGAGRLQPRRDHAARRPAPRPAPRARRPRRGRRPAADPDRRPCRHVSAAGAGHRPGPRTGGPAPAGGRRPGRRGVRRRAHHRLRRRTPRGGRVVARAGRAGHRGGRRRAAGAGRPARGGRAGDGADRPRRRAAQPGHRDGAGLDQRGARARHAGHGRTPATAA